MKTSAIPFWSGTSHILESRPHKRPNAFIKIGLSFWRESFSRDFIWQVIVKQEASSPQDVDGGLLVISTFPQGHNTWCITAELEILVPSENRMY